MDVPINKNEEYIVDIIDNGFEGEGIAKINNFTIFIPGTIKGEKVKILIVKVLSSHAFGKLIDIIIASENRTEPDCKTYRRCGGCSLRHVKYEETLKMKQNTVQSLVNKTLKNKVVVQETIGMEVPYNYRNKAQYPIGIDKFGKPAIGVFAKRTHEIIEPEKCYIQHEVAERIAKYVKKYAIMSNISIYDEKTGIGLLRHVVVKIGFKTNEVMCILVVTDTNIEGEEKLVKALTSEFPEIKTIVKNINKRNTNVILGNKNITIYGDGYITDRLGEYTFMISSLSFYQVNPVQVENLYNLAVEKAEISKEDIVFDMYCGIGTISIFVSKYAKKVYGIEIIKEAVCMARKNAKLNNVQNTEFIAGDVEEVFEDLLENKKIKPDVIIVDPPRKGLDKTSVGNILKVMPKKVVYISCNPATLVRDLEILEEKYEINSIQPVDMFPFTSHVETIAVLNVKKM